jgi:hypothetical protein
VLEFFDFAFRLEAPHLLIQRVKQLLAGGCSSERGAIVQRAAKTAEIQQTFRCTIEGYAHAIQEIDDRGRCLAHGFDRRLVCQEVAAVH